MWSRHCSKSSEIHRYFDVIYSDGAKIWSLHRCRKARKDNYERKLMESESVNNSELNTLNKRQEGRVNTSHLATSNDDDSASSAARTRTTRTAQHHHHHHQQRSGVYRGSHAYADALNEDDRMAEEEAAAAASYGVENMPPRVTRLNREEIRSTTAAAAEELDLVDMDAAAVTDGGGGSLQYRFVNGGGGLSPAYAVARHDNGRGGHVTSSSSSRRQMMTSSQFSETDDRRHVAASSSSAAGGSVSTPSTIHRNVSAFGEITVMPVGDEDEHLRISVGEEII